MFWRDTKPRSGIELRGDVPVGEVPEERFRPSREEGQEGVFAISINRRFFEAPIVHRHDFPLVPHHEKLARERGVEGTPPSWE